MKTLKELLLEMKCRKGQSAGTTKNGAYWCPCKPIGTRRAGGDGIGNSGADLTFTLEFRHFRDGGLKALIRRHAWHQNGAGDDVVISVNDLLECTTAEQVICKLKATSIGDEDCNWTDHVISNLNEYSVIKSLVALGLAESEPAPDEA